MGPDEIILAEQSEERDVGTSVKASVAPIILPISAETFDKIVKDYPCTKYEGRRVFGNTAGITDFSDIPLYYYCKCLQLDLSKSEDRAEYSELLGKSLAVNSPITILWDEKVIAGEKMILYMTFSEQIRIVGLGRE